MIFNNIAQVFAYVPNINLHIWYGHFVLRKFKNTASASLRCWLLTTDGGACDNRITRKATTREQKYFSNDYEWFLPKWLSPPILVLVKFAAPFWNVNFRIQPPTWEIWLSPTNLKWLANEINAELNTRRNYEFNRSYRLLRRLQHSRYPRCRETLDDSDIPPWASSSLKELNRGGRT